MPLFHCDECHHEWEGGVAVCDWCGAGGHVLVKKTPLEAMIEDLPAIMKKLKERKRDER
jgi:Cys-tRNA synthase (O-phospho-L-seryl-tRNA:Cys-tRNA synthase)